MSKAVRAVAAFQNRLALDFIQKQPHFLWVHVPVVQPFNEISDGPFEVDVVLPESIVAINQQCLGSMELWHCSGLRQSITVPGSAEITVIPTKSGSKLSGYQRLRAIRVILLESKP